MSPVDFPQPNAYSLAPDYTRPLLQLASEQQQRLWKRLAFLYGEAAATQNLPELERLLKVHSAHKTTEQEADNGQFDPTQRFTQRDIALITYGDILVSDSASPLATLADFLEQAPGLRGAFNTLHILPVRGTGHTLRQSGPNPLGDQTI